MASAHYGNGMAHQSALEIIRFAGANRLCVDLQYQGSRRLVEPYSLRRSRDGNLLLYAVKHLTGEPRSYRVDRIQGAIVTDKPFIPRYIVELPESGPVFAPPISRNPEIYRRPKPRKPVSKSFGISRSTSGFRPNIVFECPICGKRFTHRSFDQSSSIRTKINMDIHVGVGLECT